MKKSFNIKPKFDGWKDVDFLREHIPSISPMLCKEYTEKYLLKPEAGFWLANQKMDGVRSICIVTEKGNRFFSRRISKKTNWWAENSDCVPHLRDTKGLPVGTILDGELIAPYGKDSMDVQSVTGALPENAVKFQMAHGWLEYHVFDLLQYGEDNYEHVDYIFRASMLQSLNPFIVTPIYVDQDIKKDLYDYRGLSVIVVDSFKALKEKMWAEGKEGIVLKHSMSKYEQGKRSANWLKIKAIIDYDVIICGYQDPTREYDGKTLDEKGYWDYWEDRRGVKLEQRLTLAQANHLEPVTKPYAKDWIGAIEVGLVKDGRVVKIAEVKGISDADQEYIKANREKLIETVITIKAQEIIDNETKSLRHPRFSRWRKDKSAESCKWEDFGE